MRTIDETLMLVEIVLANHSKYLGSFGWKAPWIDEHRETMERRGSWHIEFSHGDHAYRYEASVLCYGRKVIYCPRFLKDGVLGDLQIFKTLQADLQVSLIFNED